MGKAWVIKGSELRFPLGEVHRGNTIWTSGMNEKSYLFSHSQARQTSSLSQNTAYIFLPLSLVSRQQPSLQQASLVLTPIFMLAVFQVLTHPTSSQDGFMIVLPHKTLSPRSLPELQSLPGVTIS